MNGDALPLKPQTRYYLINVPKISGDVILGKRGRYCSVYKLKDKTE